MSLTFKHVGMITLGALGAIALAATIVLTQIPRTNVPESIRNAPKTIIGFAQYDRDDKYWDALIDFCKDKPCKRDFDFCEIFTDCEQA